MNFVLGSVAGEFFCSWLRFSDMVGGGGVMGKGNKQDDGKQGVDFCKNTRNQTARAGKERMLTMENSHTLLSQETSLRISFSKTCYPE